MPKKPKTTRTANQPRLTIRERLRRTRALLYDNVDLPTCNAHMTLAQYRGKLKNDLIEGKHVTCSACGGKAALYARRFRPSWLTALDALSERGEMRSADVDALARSHDWLGLQYWKLIEQPTKKGRWRITQEGRSFLAGDFRIAERVVLHNSRVAGHDDTTMLSVSDLRAALKMGDKGFRYGHDAKGPVPPEDISPSPH